MSLFEEPVGVPAKPRATRRTTRKPALEDLPAHVKAKLEAAGAVDFTTTGPPATRRAHMIFCPGCGKGVIRGLLSMPTPWAVDADPPALTPEGEALALLTGRTTYNLRHCYDHYEIDQRGSWHWHNPRKDPHTDVVCEHRCDDPRSFTVGKSTLPPPKTFDTTPPADPPY